MKKLLSSLLVILYSLSIGISTVLAVPTNGVASPWTKEKARKLAGAMLFYPYPETVDALYAAGSATAAVDLLFPDAVGPDRTGYDAFLTNYTSSGFNWGDANHTIRLYQLMYALDPYEAKRKLFSLYEDIFAVNADGGKDIQYRDVYDLHSLLYTHSLGNYKTIVKRVLYNNGAKGDYAAGQFLDLFNQKDPNQPNENYARELLQLFLMGEYEPYQSKDNNDIRNYEETDVRALSRILTGLRADPMTHALSIDPATHYSGAPLAFLTGAYDGIIPAYYNSASGTIDPLLILQSTAGNNGLPDNVIEYIFAKRADKIALFLADRILRFYAHDKPTRVEIDAAALVIKNNNFEMLPSIKTILASDVLYTDAAMNSLRYKNPLELAIGTIKLLQKNNFTSIVNDPNLYDTNLLRRLSWTPYFPGSIFGRDGFDNSIKWNNTGVQATWMNATNYFTYRTSGTGAVNFTSILPVGRYKTLSNEQVYIRTTNFSSFSGSLTVLSGSLSLIQTSGMSSVAGVSSLADVSAFAEIGTDSVSIEQKILDNGYPLDPIQAIETGENLLMTPPDDGGAPLDFAPDILSSAPFVSAFFEPEKSVISVLSEVIDTGVTAVTVVNDTKESASATPPDMSVSTGVVDTIVVSTTTGTVDALVSTGVLDATGMTETSSGGSDTLEKIITSGVDISETSSDILLQKSQSATGNIDTTLLAVGDSSTLTITGGTVSFPQFRLTLPQGVVTLSGASYDANTRTLTILSGSLVTSTGVVHAIRSGTIMFTQDSYLVADTLSPAEIVTVYENLFFGESRIPADTRAMMVDFLSRDGSGALIPVAPSNTGYFNTYVRGLISIIMAQPEYVLLQGYDIPQGVDTDTTRIFDSVNSKLIFIELYGGNDYLSSIIPKDEYDTYTRYRTNASGSIAITGTGLVDIGDFYMNSALAYSSGTTGFKDLYDQGYLKIFNRVGGDKHSNDHDAAAKQISSYDSTTAMSAEGAFGHMIKNELESTHTISLGAKLPNIYRSGRFVNFGGNVIISNPMNGGGQWTSHMDAMVNITANRSYPANTKYLFTDTGKLSTIAKTSVSQGGAPGASGNMSSVLSFAKVLMNNNFGKTYYLGGAGGYDTHGNQFTGLNNNLRTVSAAVTSFFNDVKNTQDVTIVIFSEFGRTNYMNGDLGTDHGDGGGMFVITNNPKLRSELAGGTYGNMSIKNAKNNALGVGIDYRAVYGSVFQGLYSLDPKSYFGDDIDLARDTSTVKNTVSLANYTYQISGQNVILNGEFSVTGSNFSPGKAGYTRLVTSTGATERYTRLRESTIAGKDGYTYSFSINPVTQPYYRIESFSNQYAVSGFSGTHTGGELPTIIPSSSRQISQIQNSVLAAFGNTAVPSKLSGSGIILEGTGSKIVAPPDAPGLRLHFQSGATYVTDVTYTSGSTTWRGGFILGEAVDASNFIPPTATITSENRTLRSSDIIRMIKIGADKRGVGMQLSQPLGIELSNLTPNVDYRIITSEDGISWTDVDTMKKLYRTSATGSLIFSTDHFSYFAAISDTQTPTTPVIAPTCTITASPQALANGSGTTLSWSLQNALTGILNPGNLSVSTSGSIFLIPPLSTTTSYVLTTTNSAGSSVCSVNVVTTPTPPVTPTVLPPSCTITTSANTVYNGSGVILTWSLQNASTGVLSPLSTIVTQTGILSVVPPSSTTTPYRISVSNSAGSSSCTTQVMSVAYTSSPIVTPPPTPIVSISGPGGGGGGGPVSSALSTSATNPIRSDDRVISPSPVTSRNDRGITNTLSDIARLISDESTQNGAYVIGLSGRLWRSLHAFHGDKTEYKKDILASLQSEKMKYAHMDTRGLDSVIRFISRIDVSDDEKASLVPEIGAPIPDMGDGTIGGGYISVGVGDMTRYVAVDNTANLRTTPILSDLNILRSLSRNTPVTVLKVEGAWSLVDDGKGEGYIKTALLRDHVHADDIRAAKVPVVSAIDAKVIAPHSVYMRQYPTAVSGIVTTLFRDEGVVILDSVGKWFEVMTEKYRGFVSKKYIRALTLR